MGTKNTETQLETIYKKFPLQFSSEISLDLINKDIDVIYNKNTKSKKYYLNIIDNEGFKYKYEYRTIIAGIGNIRNPNRYFYNNIYTYENINHFCEINDIDLYINGKGLPISGFAREKLNFVNSSGKVYEVTWNQLQHYTFQYKNGYDNVKRKNFEESHMTKEKAIPVILKMQNELNRPLLQTDFDGIITSDSSVGIRVIWRIWGTFGNMIDDLNLLKHDNYYRPNSNYYIPHKDILKYIDIVCDTVMDQGRNIITTKDFKNIVGIVDIRRIRNHCELEGVDFYSVIESHGCKIQDAGNGMNHKFEDGERVVSQYEYDFSMFLRNNGITFNKIYFRDVKYKDIDDEYSGGMNCDYKIILNSHTIYVELAGILGNKQQQESYRNNIPIMSKSKEMYRQKLNLKREIFERNNLDYYILLPDEMNEETYNKIFSKYMEEVA